MAVPELGVVAPLAEVKGPPWDLPLLPLPPPWYQWYHQDFWPEPPRLRRHRAYDPRELEEPEDPLLDIPRCQVFTFHPRHYAFDGYRQLTTADIERTCTEDWIRTPLFTAEEHKQATWLEDTESLAFLYYCPSAASKRTRHTFQLDKVPRVYRVPLSAFEQQLKSIVCFGTAMIVPYRYAV
jgi:hypothetical protein